MPEWATILISLGGSAILAVLSSRLYINRYRGKVRIDLEKELVQRQQNERRVTYSNFIAFLGETFEKAGKGGPPKAKQRFFKFKVDSLLLTSDTVFRRFLDFTKLQQANVDPELESGIMLLAVSRLIRAMRVDMGYGDSTLSDDEILSIFVNDTDDLERTLAKARARENLTP